MKKQRIRLFIVMLISVMLMCSNVFAAEESTNQNYIEDGEWNFDDEPETPKVYQLNVSKSTINLNIYNAWKMDNGAYNTDDGYFVLSGYEDFDEIKITSSSSQLLYETEEYTDQAEVYLYPKKTGTYTIKLEYGTVKKSVKVVVSKIYFTRNSKTFVTDGDKTWVDGYSTILMYKGESTTIALKGAPSGSKPEWSSSNKSVATVNSAGKVTAKGLGDAVITAKVNGFTLTYRVSISYKTAIQAFRYAQKNYNSTYSQAKRMSKGYYDCSSYVWRSYASAGVYLGGTKTYAPTAADLAKWCAQNGYMIYSGTIDVSKLRPGDLIFEGGENNGRYKGIYHVDMYQGSGTYITVAREKFYLYGDLYVARPSGTKTTGLKAASSQKKTIDLSWSKTYGATGYQVYRSTKKGSGYKKAATVKKGVVKYTNTNLTSKKTYYYKVRPYWSADGHTYYGRFSSVISKKCK
jgi:hypothetical protein